LERDEREGRNNILLTKRLENPLMGKGCSQKKDWYLFTRGSIRTLRQWFPKIFERNDFIKQRVEETGRPAVVLDWGCGRGRGISGLAKKYGPNIKAYGFSKDSYKKWLKIDDVKFIHATAEDLFRYLKNDSVDLIYSRLGLSHLFPSTAKSKHDLEIIEYGTQYIEKLLKKVRKGGKIAFMSTEPPAEIKSALEQTLKDKADIEYYQGSTYLTKK